MEVFRIARNLYLSNVPVEEAIKRFQDGLDIQVKLEDIDVISALDRITAEAVYARCNSPLYNCAAMDGIAVVSANTKGASESSPLTLEDYMPVDTGDPIRPPYDAVIMAEDIQEIQNIQNSVMIIRAAATPWQHVRPVGEDIVQGEMILPSGQKIRPIDIGVLLSGGITTIKVRTKPKVTIIPTGTEIIEPDKIDDLKIKEGCIIESNSRMLEGLVTHQGGTPNRIQIVPDEYDKIKQAIKNAAETSDMVLIIAGTSAGREDHTVHVLNDLGKVLVHGVAMKPGKPVILAVVEGKPVVGVPGYPVSAYLAYENFAGPVLASLTGNLKTTAPKAKAALTRKLVSSLKHREYVRVRVGRVGDRLVATPLARGAGAAMSLVRADGFCIIDQNFEGIEAGSQVNVLLSRGLDGIENTVVSIGSHDLILDVLADKINLSSSHVGSLGGLMALKNGEAHIAPTHLLDEETGQYNIPAIKKIFSASNKKMALIKGVGRTQGIILPKGNPNNIMGIADLPRSAYINRQRGAGTRLLLDYKLKTMDIDPSTIPGYEREAATHMAVAAAVKEGGANAGLGVLSAAKAMDLDFVPIGDEEYDFAISAEFLELEQIREFINAIKSAEFQKKLEELGGYTTQKCGEVIIIDY